MRTYKYRQQLSGTEPIINSGLECGSGTEKPQSVNRMSYYQSHAEYQEVPIESDEVIGCKDMKPFDNNGSAALDIYWEQSWSSSEPYACHLVNYQTPFSALNEGDYVSCVEYHNPDVIIVGEGGGDEELPPNAVINGPEQAESAGQIILSAEQSNDPHGEDLDYQWILPEGVSSAVTDEVTLKAALPE
ncbi:hypothetical protein [Psychromonas ossibalaenae]|uniref:hypothetical protein n=1 Tax=Psychromonas ossibalaenae TaxID=444922 RepID=UPI0003691F62|nr:hypothetical protein [Psychromonas ossibalaenae]